MPRAITIIGSRVGVESGIPTTETSSFDPAPKQGEVWRIVAHLVRILNQCP